MRNGHDQGKGPVSTGLAALLVAGAVLHAPTLLCGDLQVGGGESRVAGCGLHLVTEAGVLQPPLQLVSEEHVGQLALTVPGPMACAAPEDVGSQVQQQTVRRVRVVQVASIHSRLSLLRCTGGDLRQGHVPMLLCGGLEKGPEPKSHQKVAEVIRLDLDVEAVLCHLDVQAHNASIVADDVQAIVLLFELIGKASDALEVTVVHLHDRDGFRVDALLLQLRFQVGLDAIALLDISYGDDALGPLGGQGLRGVET